MEYKNIGNNIKHIRKIRGLSAADFAKKIDVSAATVSKWENGKSLPRFYKIELIAKALNVPDSLLLSVNIDSSFTEVELTSLIEDYKQSETLVNTSIYKFLYEDNPFLGSLFNAFDKLSLQGKLEAINRIEEMAELKRFTED